MIFEYRCISKQQQFIMIIQIKRQKLCKVAHTTQKAKQRLQSINKRHSQTIKLYTQLIRNPPGQIAEVLSSPLIIQQTSQQLLVSRQQFTQFLLQYCNKLTPQDIEPFLQRVLSMLKLINNNELMMEMDMFMEFILDEYGISVEWIMIFCELVQKQDRVRDKLVQRFTKNILKQMHIRCVSQLFISIFQSILYYKVADVNIAYVITTKYLLVLQKYKQDHLKQYIESYFYYVRSVNEDVWSSFICKSSIFNQISDILQGNYEVNNALEFFSIVVEKVELGQNIVNQIAKCLATYRKQISVYKLCKVLTNSIVSKQNVSLIEQLNNTSLIPSLIQLFSKSDNLNRQQQKGLLKLLYHLTLEDYISNWISVSVALKFKRIIDDLQYQLDILDIMLYLSSDKQDSIMKVLEMTDWFKTLEQLLMESKSEDVIVSCDILIQQLESIMSE